MLIGGNDSGKCLVRVAVDLDVRPGQEQDVIDPFRMVVDICIILNDRSTGDTDITVRDDADPPRIAG